jgi:putative transposase
MQSGNDRQTVFRQEEDYRFYLEWLRQAAAQFKVALHAYVLMPNHVHLLVSPTDETGLARMMQWVGRHYVPWFNRKYERTGTLWQGRFKASVVDADAFFLLCCRYIECNPVRANLVNAIADYPWSSYAHHAGLMPSPLITDHPLYWALGNTPFQREMAYQQMAAQSMTESQHEQIRQALLKGWALGSARYVANLEQRSARRVAPAKRGRPPKLPT